MQPNRDTRSAPRRLAALAAALGATLLGLAGTAVPAHAATRPYAITESAVALPPGGMRLEAGLSREDWDSGHRLYAYTAEFSYSLYANLDLEVEVPWVVAGKTGAFDDGFGDIRGRAKINFVKERPAIPLTLSGLVEVKFPTGDALVSSEEADVRLAGLASKVFGPAVVHGNLWYTFVGDGAQPLKNVLGLSLGVAAKTPVEGLTGIGEFIWEQPRVAGTDPRLQLVGGAQYALTQRLSIDGSLRLGFGTGVLPNEGSPDYTLAAGLTWDLNR
jgi:hypothetical protein